MYMRLLIFVVLVLCFPVVHLPGASSPTPDPRQEMLQAVTALQAARVLGQLNPVPATSAEAQSRMKAYDELIRRFPNEAEPHVAFGEYLTDLGANEKAFVQWTSALKIDPERHDVLAAQADLLLQTGQIVAAADALEKAVRLAPTNADYFFSLAHIYTMFRRDLIASRLSTEDALIARGTDYFRQAAELAPDNLRYAQAYAEAFYTEPNQIGCWHARHGKIF